MGLKPMIDNNLLTPDLSLGLNIKTKTGFSL